MDTARRPRLGFHLSEPLQVEPTRAPLEVLYPRLRLADDTLTAAAAILGARLVRTDDWGVRVGRIVEVEAYGGVDDGASHARFGPTKRNAVMFGPPGHAYVYLVYGMHECLNVVSEPIGRAAAILVRSVEPLEGVDLMRRARDEWVVARARGRGAAAAERPVRADAPDASVAAARLLAARQRVAALPDARLASGPGLVCAAFSIGRAADGADLCAPDSSIRLEVARPGDPPVVPVFGPRIGIGYAPEAWRSKPWRVWAAGCLAVSGSRGPATAEPAKPAGPAVSDPRVSGIRS